MGHTSQLDGFLNLHRDQLVSSSIPEHYWSTIYDKIHNQEFDAGQTFQLLQIEYDREKLPHEPAWGLQVVSAIQKTDPKHIYLIDHAWTFRINHAKKQLFEFDSLRNRLCNILGLKDNLSKDESVEQVFENVWKLCHTYSIGNAQNVEDRLPVWYVLDEIGSAAMHSDAPNWRIVPFVHINAQITYSLLFPVRDVSEGEFVGVDLAEGVVGEVQRAAALLPWVPHDFNDVGFVPEMPGPDYYLGGHIRETLPQLSRFSKTKIKESYKVFTEYSFVKQYLTHERFEFVDDETEADILWYTKHFKDFGALSETPEKFVNQFPFEYVITVKDLFALTCRKTPNSNHAIDSITWWPVTYNLKSEIGNFVSYFQHRERENLDNFWIIKPYNLARSLDIHITNNLNYIMRLPASGPKICQKYVTDPVLFLREDAGLVKFDVRYVILLKSVDPLEVYVYKNFFLRFANKAFELNDFQEYEKHFTVMNYENVVMKHLPCSEFLTQWKSQYPDHSWVQVEELILKMLRQVMENAVRDAPPCGIAPSPQSRALYAADIILEWAENREIRPKILEINWTPDCKRACEYYNNFYNDIFELFFLGEQPGVFVKL